MSDETVPAPLEGELLGDYRTRAGLPGADTAAAKLIRWRGGTWRRIWAYCENTLEPGAFVWGADAEHRRAPGPWPGSVCYHEEQELYYCACSLCAACEPWCCHIWDLNVKAQQPSTAWDTVQSMMRFEHGQRHLDHAPWGCSWSPEDDDSTANELTDLRREVIVLQTTVGEVVAENERLKLALLEAADAMESAANVIEDNEDLDEECADAREDAYSFRELAGGDREPLRLWAVTDLDGKFVSVLFASTARNAAAYWQSTVSATCGSRDVDERDAVEVVESPPGTPIALLPLLGVVAVKSLAAWIADFKNGPILGGHVGHLMRVRRGVDPNDHGPANWPYMGREQALARFAVKVLAPDGTTLMHGINTHYRNVACGDRDADWSHGAADPRLVTCKRCWGVAVQDLELATEMV